MTKLVTIFLFILFLFSGTALRVYKLDTKSLWYDELHSIIPTDPSNSLTEVISYSKGDQPPAFFLLLYGWYKVFPYDEASGKALCVLIGILGVVAMFFLGKELYGQKAGLASMFLTSTNIFHIYYSQELRFYGLLFLFTAISFLTFIRFLRVPSYRNQVFFVLASTALLYTHYFGIVVVVSQAIIFVSINISYTKGIHFFAKGALCAAIVLLLFSPWLPIILKDNQTSAFWIQNPGPLFFVEYFSRYFNGWWALSFKYLLSSLLFLMILHYVRILTNDFLKQQEDATTIIRHLIIVLWAILTLLIPYIYTLVKLPMLVDRYTLITLPAILIMIAIGYVTIKNYYLRIFILLIFIFLNLRVYHRYYNKFKKPEYRELSQQIILENNGIYPVLSAEAWHFNYYFRKYKSAEVVGLHDVNYSVWLNDKEKFWVIFPEHLNKDQIDMIGANFEVEKTLEFHRAGAQLYSKKH